MDDDTLIILGVVAIGAYFLNQKGGLSDIGAGAGSIVKDTASVYHEIITGGTNTIEKSNTIFRDVQNVITSQETKIPIFTQAGESITEATGLNFPSWFAPTAKLADDIYGLNFAQAAALSNPIVASNKLVLDYAAEKFTGGIKSFTSRPKSKAQPLIKASSSRMPADVMTGQSISNPTKSEKVSGILKAAGFGKTSFI